MAEKTLDASPRYVPVRDDLFTMPLDPLDKVRLQGTKCRSCGEVSLGKASACPNCIGTDLEQVGLSKEGKLWTYTVIRSKPPGDYKGPDPFVPFGLGLVELPDGIRVLGPVSGDVNNLKIGMNLVVDVYKLYTDENGKDVIAFRFNQA